MHDDFPRIDRAIERQSGAPLSGAELRPVTIADLALHIYTSGTTGLPKAANISHQRLLTWSLWFGGMLDTRPSDRMYDCLPMYHSVGGIVAIGALLVNGGSVLIREKFSARQFWDDVTGFDCTLFQYIGELCRYLVHAPPHPRETQHRLRIACGNGLAARRVERRSRTASGSRRSSNSMPRPKATSRSTMPRASPAPSAAFRRSWRAACRPR